MQASVKNPWHCSLLSNFLYAPYFKVCSKMGSVLVMWNLCFAIPPCRLCNLNEALALALLAPSFPSPAFYSDLILQPFQKCRIFLSFDITEDSATKPKYIHFPESLWEFSFLIVNILIQWTMLWCEIVELVISSVIYGESLELCILIWRIHGV